jgi:hypothetical protein
MARKKYQVFISSTYEHMKGIRQAAVESILRAGHIPAGMELFSAGDESQLDVIRRWIEESDIFMLILGGRYGSIEPKSGLSYIELEYEHAQKHDKPYFSLVLSEEGMRLLEQQFGPEARETAQSARYDGFKSRVLSKVSRIVDDEKDVKLCTMESIHNVEDKHSLTGWVRGNDQVDVQPLLNQVNKLQETMNELTAENARLKQEIGESTQIKDLAGLSDAVSIPIKYVNEFRGYDRDKTVTLTWAQLFGLLAPKLLEHPSDSLVRTYLTTELLRLVGVDKAYQADMPEQSFQTIKVQLEAMGLVIVDYTATVSGGMALFWNITEHGKKKMIELRTVRSVGQK